MPQDKKPKAEGPLDILSQGDDYTYQPVQASHPHAGEAMTEVKGRSPVVASSRAHRFPIDDHETQRFRTRAFTGLPTPDSRVRAWMDYYHGAYVRKHSTVKQTLAQSPGQVDLLLADKFKKKGG